MTPEFIVPASAGSLAVAAIAMFFTVFQGWLATRRHHFAWNAWGAAMSLFVSVYVLTGFCQFNAGATPINHIIELIQYTTFVCCVHSGFGFSLSYLGIPAGRYHRIAGPFHVCLLLLLWTTKLVVLDSFVAREFLWLYAPYIEPDIGVLGPAYLLYCVGACLWMMRLWIQPRHRKKTGATAFIIGFLFWITFAVHDAMVTMGVRSVLFFMEYGFLGFATAILSVTIAKYAELFDFAENSNALLKNTHVELEKRVTDRTLELTQLNQKLWKQLSINRRNERQLLVVTRQMKEELAERKRLEEKVTAVSIAKSEFLANMSHEIRDPLNALIGFSEMSMSCTDNKKKSEYLAFIANSAKVISHLVKDVLDISRIESGKLELDCADFDPRSLVRTSLDMFSLQAKQNGIDFVLEMPEEMPSILYGDQVRLGQVLTNIVGNAVKFTNHGKVKVSLTVEHSKTEAREVILTFQVADTGIGIHPEKWDRVFEVFSQAEASTTRLYGGTGLGMAISQRLVQLMRGNIGFESTPGIGTTFTFWAPFVVQHPPASDHIDIAEPVPATCLRQLNILVVEDNPFNRRLYLDALTDMGQRVTTAEQGVLAVQYFREQSFDLVLMDVNMPGMNGYDAVRAIRGIESGWDGRPPVTIIGITANARPEDRQACLESGMDDVFFKPVNVSLFGELLLKMAQAQDVVLHRNDSPLPPQTLPTPLSRQIIHNIGANPDRLKKYLELLLEDMGTQIGVMESACKAGDAKALQAAGHTVKGLALALADPEAGRIAEDIENQAKTENIQTVNEQLSRLKTLYETLIQSR
jgi:signal transduction histidine kinase/DNA-binding NarL/FixJ family response regulator